VKSWFLIGLSALALVVMIGVQVMFIRETYTTKRNQLDAKYGALVREALAEMNNRSFDYAFDSVMFTLDSLALEYLFIPPDSVRMSMAKAFNRVLSGYNTPEDYIREYVTMAGEQPSFSYHLVIRELYLTDLGFETMVYPDSIQLPHPPDEALLVGTYTHQRNFFRLSYDILINFRNRTRLVLNEMWLILGLSVLTLILVFTVYVLTLRNMLRQKRLSELKTDFINNMTHELKTPLSTISVASSSLGNKRIIQQEDKVEELSGLIKKQNRHLTALIDRILDIHIWEKDQVRIRKHAVDTASWLNGLAKAFSLERGDKQVEVEVRADTAPTELMMDEVHMSTAINNLLSNAVKYGHPPVRIVISAEAVDGSLVLGVTDNGPGISREDMKHLFEKFYRGRESKKRVIRGLGLGLYYVKQIVEAHGGTIEVRSGQGKGTSFYMTIPMNHGNITG